ncbi:MAG: hypothetical protein CMJ34_05735 [Phycisphaerae bacterium]|nr:hypothetical protein [Phycisphaerae bacterium]
MFVHREVQAIDQHVTLTADLPHDDVEPIDVVVADLVLTFVLHRWKGGEDQIGLTRLASGIRDRVEIASEIRDPPGGPAVAIRFHPVTKVRGSHRDMDHMRAEPVQQIDDFSRDLFESDERIVASDHGRTERCIHAFQMFHDGSAKIPAGLVGDQQYQPSIITIVHALSVGWAQGPYEHPFMRNPRSHPFMPLRSLRDHLPLVALIAIFTAGCDSTPSRPDYERALPPGATALRPVPPGSEPDLEAAWLRRDEGLRESVDQSLSWFDAPSSRQWWPYDLGHRTVSHEEARASVQRFGELLDECSDATTFRRRMLDEFRIYQSVGWNGEGVVLYTGYYAPEFDASPVRTSRFTTPLHVRPDDLVTHPETGVPIGQRLPNGRIGRYPTRREIHESGMFEGDELVWVETPLDAYVIQVNGSAKLRMPDGSIEFIGYDGKTDRMYTGLGTTLFDRGHIEKKDLPAIYELFERNPELVMDGMLENESYVFFRHYDGSTWPSGSLGRKVTGRASLATDKDVYPRACVTFVDTEGIEVSGADVPIQRFMLDQDTGGAIRAPGRADIYMGEGADAETLAGGQYAEGRLYYFFLRN